MRQKMNEVTTMVIIKLNNSKERHVCKQKQLFMFVTK